MTELQSAILAALRTRHPEAMTEIEIWEQVSNGQIAMTTVYIACADLEKAGLIQSVENGKKWKLTDPGKVGQPEAGAGRKTLLSSEIQDAPLREAAESSQSGHGFAPSPAGAGEAESCGDNLHASCTKDAVILPAGLSDFDCGGVKRISRQAHSPEITGSTPVPATSLDESGLSAGATFGTQCEKSCSGCTRQLAEEQNSDGVSVESLHSIVQDNQAAEVTNLPTGLKTSNQIGAEIATDGDQHKCGGSTSSRAATLCAGDVPQPLSAESMSCGARAATGKDGSRAASRKADGTLGNETRQDCGSDEVESLIPQVSSIPDGVEGDDRAAGQIFLSPEFHAIHIADEGANSTRAWWGELEREAQEALAGELVSNERWR